MNFQDLELPFDEAENYFKPDNKIQFNRLFYKDEQFEKIKKPTTYFIIGEKGSGKTAYSAYFCNNTIANTISKRYVITVDDYCKIIQMKQEGKLKYTHYTTLWKVILLIKIFSTIGEKEISFFGSEAYKKIKVLLKLYNFTEITADSFSPVSVIDNESFAGTVGIDTGATFSGVTGKCSATASENVSTEFHVNKEVYYDNWLTFLNTIISSLASLNLKNHHYLFVDGIDTRPQDISYNEYKECVYPLIRAVYELNDEVFSHIKDRKKGRLQIVLLTRLDIFINAGLSNPGSKVEDNAAFLNWYNLNETEYKKSDIFSLVNTIIKAGEKDEEESDKDFWNTYFNFTIDNLDSFVYFLRHTTGRPRDFVKILKFVQVECKREKKSVPQKGIIQSDSFRRAYSTYFVDSIKTGLSFYYSKEDISALFSFLKSIKKIRFEYSELCSIFKMYIPKQKSNVFADVDVVLKLLFDYNMICYIESEGIYRWKYKEVSIADYDYSLPDEALQKGKKFMFHPALEKELSLYLDPNSTPKKRQLAKK